MTGREFYERLCKEARIDPSWEGLGTNDVLVWEAIAALSRQQSSLIGGMWSGIQRARQGKKGVKNE